MGGDDHGQGLAAVGGRDRVGGRDLTGDVDAAALPLEVVRQIRDQLSAKYQVIDIDGARADFGDGWGLVRNSNTSPALTVRCEATTPEGLKRITAEMKALLAAQPSVDLSAWPA